MSTKQASGYTFGTQEVARSPISMEELAQLEKTVTLSDEDIHYLRMAGEVLLDQVEDILDVWYEFIASQPQLAYYFTGPTGRPNTEYLVAVRDRFGQWILDTCNRPYDQEWLDYQYEIALRHTRAKKNKTDHVEAAPIVHLRYLVAMVYPVVTTIRPFLAKRGYSAEEVDRMYNAWFKAVVLQVALWCQPYANEGDY